VITFILTPIFFYLLFIPTAFLCHYLLFPENTPELLPSIFFIIMGIQENFSFIFLRTRTSIKYFPPMINLLTFSFLFYINCNVYPFFHLALYLFIYSCAILNCIIILFVEIPSRRWPVMKPNKYSPRMMYLPVFSMNWMRELPHLWTMFFPLYGRSQFNNNMLALVDNQPNRLETNNLDEYNLRNRNMYSYDTLYLLRNSDINGLNSVRQEGENQDELGPSDFDGNL
jgi:hypothetical protein